jgi:hypothetical protein
VSVRSEIAEALTEALPATFRVMDYVKQLDNTDRPVVMLHRSKVRRNDSSRAYLDHSMTAHVLVPETLGAAAEDAADDALDAVLGALEGIGYLDWEEAERTPYANFTGYQITLTVSKPHTLGV